jgi:FkbM family methyltransferase
MYKTSDSCQIYNLAEKYMEYFSGKTDGYFVEVGAFDGYSYSNTWGLVEAGWGGHYIEPIPSIFKRCQERYIGNDKIKCHELAIGSFNGEIQILESGEFSTSNKKHIDIYNGANSTAYKGKQWLTVKQKTLNNFLLENNVPKYFDLLCVDVEGNEYDVLK